MVVQKSMLPEIAGRKEVSPGFHWWDRRTTVRKAQEETVQITEKDGRLVRLIQALREVAVDDARMAKALRTYGFL